MTEIGTAHDDFVLFVERCYALEVLAVQIGWSVYWYVMCMNDVRSDFQSLLNDALMIWYDDEPFRFPPSSSGSHCPSSESSTSSKRFDSS
jgi:hypothetical protein